MGTAGKPDTYDGKGKRLYIVTYGWQMGAVLYDYLKLFK
jgi:hypothetical protein